ncbi:exported hypothetical protein [Mesorhizobium sp. ORS 3324]|nr:exported hypothetical protein [Mesorhizobium sp. ORS 3324]
MSFCLSSLLSPALAAKPLQLVRPGQKSGEERSIARRSRAETREAKSAYGFMTWPSKATALRSAPSKDRQIAGVYTAIPEEGKGGGRIGRSAASQDRKSEALAGNGRRAGYFIGKRSA